MNKILNIGAELTKFLKIKKLIMGEQGKSEFCIFLHPR